MPIANPNLKGREAGRCDSLAEPSPLDAGPEVSAIPSNPNLDFAAKIANPKGCQKLAGG